LSSSFLYGLAQIDTNDDQANTSYYRPAEERKGAGQELEWAWQELEGAWQELEGAWLEPEGAWQEPEGVWQEPEGVWQEPLKEEEEGPGGMTLISYCSILWDSGMEAHTKQTQKLNYH
jgi:hypothetical protein